MKKVVVIQHIGDSGNYLFAVPEDKTLEKDHLVVVQNKRGNTLGVCACDSFEVQDNALEVIAKRFNAKLPLAPVIGMCRTELWENGEQE